MAIIKIQNTLSGSAKGSAKNAISYLQKENRVREKSKRSTEQFFNQTSNEITPKAALKIMDSFRQGIRSHEDKYFSLILSPSAKELANLTDDNLKEYTRKAMIAYAKNFKKGVNPEKLGYVAKLEYTRKYKGYKKKKKTKLNLPAGVKSGDFKPGDQRHIHVLVRRQTDDKVRVSPMVNARKGKANAAFGGKKIGFNRIEFSEKADIILRSIILKNNPKHLTFPKDIRAYGYLKNNEYNYDKANKLGFNSDHVEQIKKREEKKELLRIEAENRARAEQQKQAEARAEQQRQAEAKAEAQRQAEARKNAFSEDLKYYISKNDITVILPNLKVFKFIGYNEDHTQLKVRDKNGNELLIPNSKELNVFYRKPLNFSKSQNAVLSKGGVTSVALSNGSKIETFTARIVKGRTVLKPISKKQHEEKVAKNKTVKKTKKKGRRL